MPSVYGIGNPLLDIIMTASFDALGQLGATPGSMNLVDHDAQQRVIEMCTIRSMRAGGSCANTIRGVGWLLGGGNNLEAPCYTGAVGPDDVANTFEKLLVSEGVTSLLARKNVPTGQSAIAVTPDSERTMFTNLAACRELRIGDIHTDILKRCSILHTTGYMWDTPNQQEAAERSVEIAREAGVVVSFDIADPFVVERYREALLQWIPGRVDVLFANEEELRRLTGIFANASEGSRRAVLKEARNLAPRVVMKVGAEGCFVADDDGDLPIPGEKAPVVDTTGAGDAFAGGFLFGLLAGSSPAEAGILANRFAAAIVGVEGCTYSEINASWVRELLSS